MKKHNLFKILAILLLLVVVATYVVPLALGNEISSYLGLGDVVINFIQSFYYFFDTIAFVLVVGGFYGFLSKVPAYKTLINSIANKFKDKGKWVVIAVTIIFALIGSLTGIELPMFIVIPFVVAIIIAMGYDKLVAVSSTIGGILVGNMAGIFATFRNPSSNVVVTFEGLVGLDNIYANIIPKIILLVLGVGLLVFYILRHIKKASKNELNYDLGEKLELTGKTSSKDSKVSLWPMIILGGLLVKYITIIVNVLVDIPDFSWKIFNYSSICNIVILVATIVLVVKFGRAKETRGNTVFGILMIVMLLFLILGLMPWNSLFEITFFDELHAAVIEEFTFKNFSIFDNILSVNFVAFGNWVNWGSFILPMSMLIIMSLIFKFTYNIKFDEAFDGYVEGFKKTIPTVVLVAIAYTVLVSVVNNGFFGTLITACGDNVLLQLLMTIIGSLLTVDLYYSVAMVFSPIFNVVLDHTYVMSLAFQSLRGLVQLIGPTSLLLIVGLTYFDVPYRTWVKYVWRLVVLLFIIVFATLLIMALI